MSGRSFWCYPRGHDTRCSLVTLSFSYPGDSSGGPVLWRLMLICDGCALRDGAHPSWGMAWLKTTTATSNITEIHLIRRSGVSVPISKIWKNVLSFFYQTLGDSRSSNWASWASKVFFFIANVDDSTRTSVKVKLKFYTTRFSWQVLLTSCPCLLKVILVRLSDLARVNSPSHKTRTHILFSVDLGFNQVLSKRWFLL